MTEKSAAAAVHIIAGPTAGGKSAYALRRAAKENGVIINADSMQIYDALPILTAAPRLEEMQGIPHRLYNILPPAERCSAARWCSLAHLEIARVLTEGRTPFLVGGTGLYLKALMEGLAPIPDIPQDVRENAVREQERLGNPAFHAALALKDPVMAARLHPQDTQRLIRAWEVWEATGRSLASWQIVPPDAPPAHYHYHVTLILPPRGTLYDRCNRRFDMMMENGALEETAAFARRIDKGDIPEDAPVTGALGFKPLRAYLQGEQTREEALKRAKTDTRHYAKRQVTWFRHQVRAGEIVENL